MKLKEKLQSLLVRMQEAVRRFPASFVTSMILSGVIIFSIMVEDDHEKLIFSLGMALLVCLLAEIAHEYGAVKFPPFIPAAVTGVVCYVLLYNWSENDYVAMGVVGFAFIVPCLIMVLLYRHNDQDHLCSWLVKSALYAVVTTGVIFCGLLVCLLAFYYLIHEFQDLYKYIVSLFVLCELAGCFNLFISYIPRAGQQLTVPRAYSSVIHRALFYVYILLVGILYLYIAKIIITWTMPVGVLNWFGSITLLFYVFFYLSVTEEDGRPQQLFRQYGVWFILPVLLVQLYAIYIRLSAYGLTSVRYVSLALIVIAVCFMVASQLKADRSIPFVMAAIIIALITMTPANLLDVPNLNQELIMKKVMKQTGLYEDGKVVVKEIDAEKKETLEGAFRYLKYSSGRKSEFVQTVLDSPLDDIFYTYRYENTRSAYYSISVWSGESFDIEQYRTVSKSLINGATDVGGYDCTDYFGEVMDSYDLKREFDHILKYEPDENTLIVFEDFSIEYNVDTREINYLDGIAYIFRK